MDDDKVYPQAVDTVDGDETDLTHRACYIRHPAGVPERSEVIRALIKEGTLVTNNDSETIERVAAVVHRQWMDITRAILDAGLVGDVQRKRWEAYHVPYEELDDDTKELDRIRARELLEAVRPEVSDH